MKLTNPLLIAYNQLDVDYEVGVVNTLSGKQYALIDGTSPKVISTHKVLTLASQDTTLSMEMDSSDFAFNESEISIAFGGKYFVSKDTLVIKTLAYYANSSLLSCAVGEFFRLHDVDDTTIGMIDLCITEIFNNVIEHAYKKEGNDPVSLILSFENGLIAVGMLDYGFKPERALLTPEKIGQPSNDSDCGRGIGIVNAVMDQCGFFYENNMNFFHMSKDIRVALSA